MPADHSNQNLQKVSFKDQQLSNANFSGSDLRGTDFSGADLTGANFTKARTGITVTNVALLFFAALAISLLSGYIAMLAGHTIQMMVDSKDTHVRTAGIISAVVSILFIIYFWWRGGRTAIMQLIVPLLIVAAVVGVVSYASGIGTGEGMAYQILALVLLSVMFVVGTIARAAAGNLSNIIFFIVALSGGIFSRSVGGGVGTMIMAIACMQISKRALKGVKGFEFLQRIGFLITSKLGTSFREAKLTHADFSGAKIHNADFSNADTDCVNWGDSKRIIASTINNKGIVVTHRL